MGGDELGDGPALGVRALAAARLFVFAGVLIALVGLAAHEQGWPWLTSSLGPTAYVFLAHPQSETSKLGNALIGHGIAIACGLFSLAVFGLWTHPSIPDQHGHTTLTQLAACAVAIGLTLGLLELLNKHHAPAGATTLLIATGISRPYTPLYGLLIGLGVVIALSPLLTRLPFGRQAAASEN